MTSPNEELKQWVEKLWESLQRASGCFTDNASIETVKTGELVTLRLWSEIPKDGRAPMLNYVRMHATEHGWLVLSIDYKKFLLRFIVRRA